MGELSAARQTLESADVRERIDEPSTKTPSAAAGVVRRVEAQRTSRIVPLGCRRVSAVFEHLAHQV